MEREIGKIPFSYSIKKEMEKFLRKPENPNRHKIQKKFLSLTLSVSLIMIVQLFYPLL